MILNMNISLNNHSLNFGSKYKLNANQPMPDERAVARRDIALGFWTQFSSNGNTIYEDLQNFYKGAYNDNPSSEYNIELDIPDQYDAVFEEYMNAVGQNFNKIG